MQALDHRAIVAHPLQEGLVVICQLQTRRKIQYHFNLADLPWVAQHVFGYIQTGTGQIDSHIAGFDSNRGNHAGCQAYTQSVGGAEPLALPPVIRGRVCFYDGATLQVGAGTT
jgi:hypothetical protein